MLHRTRTAKLCALFATLSALSSCSVIGPHLPSNKTTKVNFTIDEAATILPAEYSKNYLLEGNIVARYQDFDFVRISSETVPKGHNSKLAGEYSVFEIRNRNGKTIKRLLISPKNQKQLLRFSVHGKNYFINEGKADGSFTISIPSHLLA